MLKSSGKIFAKIEWKDTNKKTFLDSLVHRSGGSTSDQARFRTFASQRLACANASGMAKPILSFNNHIRRSDGAVVRSARDVRLPQVPEAPIGSHRQRLAPTRAAVSPVEDFERDSAERNTTFIAHTSPVHQDPRPGPPGELA